MTARWLDLSPAQYHALRDDCITQSLAVELLTNSPAHARRKQQARAEPHTPTSEDGAERRRSMEYGTLVHAILLGGRDDRLEVAVDADGQPFDNWKKKAAQALRKSTYAAGKIPVLQSKVDQAKRFCDRIREKLERHGIDLSEVPRERCNECAFQWEEDGVLARGMDDHVNLSEAIVYDVKTTGDAHPERFKRQLDRMGYDVQAAAYTRALEALYPRLAGRVRFRWILCETGSAEVVVLEATPGMLHLGGLKWARACRTWAQCLATDRWPGYGNGGIVYVEPSEWAVAAEMRASHEQTAQDFAAMAAPREAASLSEPLEEEDDEYDDSPV